MANITQPQHVRYQEVPEAGKTAIMATVYVKKWFVGDSKQIKISIENKD